MLLYDILTSTQFLFNVH